MPAANATAQARTGARVPRASRVAYAYASVNAGPAARNTIPATSLLAPIVSWVVPATTSPSGNARQNRAP